ncbi:hypothetical protein Tco_0773347 [Tanacetum coccineum]|uniref:Uncharacterized protein n=1 Tax=Tanacetum coccineum TaxID=301880 RepID=A0ABQ4ZLS9_9ASTR
MVKVHVLSQSPPASPIRLLGYRAVMIWLRSEAASTSHSLPLPPPIILSHARSDAPSSGTPPLLPIPLPTSSPPLHLLSTDHRADRPEVTLPPQKRLGIALGLRYEVREKSSAAARPPRGFRADYGFVSTIDREIMRDLERDLMAGRLNMLYRDRRAHALTARLMEAKARMSREAWGRSMDVSDLARAEVMSLRTQAADRRRQAAITEMLAADRRRQEQFIKVLKLLKRLQTQMTEFKRQQGPAKGPAQPDAPEEAGSSS